MSSKQKWHNESITLSKKNSKIPLSTCMVTGNKIWICRSILESNTTPWKEYMQDVSAIYIIHCGQMLAQIQVIKN